MFVWAFVVASATSSALRFSARIFILSTSLILASLLALSDAIDVCLFIGTSLPRGPSGAVGPVCREVLPSVLAVPVGSGHSDPFCLSW